MVIDIAVYEGSKEFVLRWHKRRSDFSNTISVLPSATFVPCIAIAIWIGEHDGWTPELMATIDSLIAFYGYSKINGKPIGCPILI
jgi:hypothetical protein